MVIKITIPGKPIPKKRPRMAVRRGTAYVYTPPETQEYEAKAGWAARAAMGAQGPLTGQVSLRVSVYAKGNLDLDNVIKTLGDACNGIAYIDDMQVVRIIAAKHKVKDKADERVEIEIEEVEYDGLQCPAEAGLA